MTIPGTNISHSLEMETRRLLYLAAKLPTQTYQNRNYLVLPKVTPSAPSATVVFPDLPYSTIPKFWSRVSRLKLTTPIVAPTKLVEETSALLQPHYLKTVYDNHVVHLNKAFSQIESTFWSHFFTLFPKYKSNLRKVNIFVTLYGPPTTFSLVRNKQTDITMFVRYDSSLDKVLWTLLACLLRPRMQDELHHTWEEIEATIDFLMRESSLNCGLKLTNPTIKNLRNPQIAEYRRQSGHYLASLGLSQLSPWQTDQGNIYFGTTKITDLTPKEQILLEVLLTKRGETVSYDEIADNLWPMGENFSLFAITKEVERLRSKIRSAGINLPVIQAHRKVGYSIH